MKTNEILQGNRILAEFMGLKPSYNSYTGKYNWGDGIFFMTNGDTIEEVMASIVGYVKYHASWDWLMPVVEKCYSTNLYYRYKDESCRQFFEGGIELTTNIDDVWLACVEFVKWLNEQQ